MNDKIIQVLRYPGSKWNITEWIISNMPPHKAYLEPFFGSGAVFFRKDPVGYETINDLNSDVTNLFKIIRDKPEELTYLVDNTPFSREEFYGAHGNENLSDIEKARCFLIRSWQGFGARQSSKSGWSCEIKPGAKQNSIVKRWNRVTEAIAATAERLKWVQIENINAIDLIKRYYDKNILIYADPPYIFETRTGGKYYTHEMTNEEHLELIKVLNNHPGPVLLSGYESELYINNLNGWQEKQLFAMTEKGQTRKEILWINNNALKQLEIMGEQTKLFI